MAAPTECTKPLSAKIGIASAVIKELKPNFTILLSPPLPVDWIGRDVGGYDGFTES